MTRDDIEMINHHFCCPEILTARELEDEVLTKKPRKTDSNKKFNLAAVTSQEMGLVFCKKLQEFFAYEKQSKYWKKTDVYK